MNSGQKIALAGMITFVSIWTIALGLPAYFFTDGGEPLAGFLVFILGFFTLYNPLSPDCLAWLFGNGGAFAAVILGIIAINSRKPHIVSRLLTSATLSAGLAFVFSFLCLAVEEGPRSDAVPSVPVYPGPAAYLWIASMLPLLVLMLLATVKNKRAQPQPQSPEQVIQPPAPVA